MKTAGYFWVDKTMKISELKNNMNFLISDICS